MHRLLGLLVWILGAHAAGIGFADRGGRLPGSFGLPVSAAAIGLGLLLLQRVRAGRRRFSSNRRSPSASARRVAWTRIAAWIALALVAFGAGYGALARELDRAGTGRARAAAFGSEAIRLVDARVHARRPTRFGDEVELWDARGRPGEGEVPERMILSLAPGRDVAGLVSRSDRLLWPGMEVRLALRIEPLHPSRNPGTADREHALARRGIAARARLLKPDWVVERVATSDPAARIAAVFAAFRRDACERIRARLEGQGEGSGLVRALAVGDRRGLPDATRESFRQLGLTHLISVSGLHIGFVALPAAWSVARLRTRYRLRSRVVRGFASPIAAGCLAGGLYAWLTGAEVAALRASLLFGLFGAARILGWTIPPAPALAAIALALLLADPANLFDVGAQFSFGACAALVASGIWSGRMRRETTASASGPASGRITKLARRAGRVLGEALRASLAVSLGMLPLVELYGLPRSLPGPLVNALAIPWTGFVVMPCALLAAVLASILPDEVGSGVLSRFLLPAAWLERNTGALAEILPSGWIGEDLPGRIPWPCALACIALVLVRFRRGGGWRAAWLWVPLAWAGITPLQPAAFEGALPRVVFFDVGQADAALIQAPEVAWLIDTGSGPGDGSGGGTLLRALRAQGVTRLDVLAITHGDLDHRGGALRVLSAMKVNELWLPALSGKDPGLDALAESAAANGVSVRRVAAGERRTFGEAMAVDVLWPPAPGSGDPSPGRGRSRNETSLVLRVDFADARMLLTGDVGAQVEAALLARPDALRSDVLKVAHHGSRQSSEARFLAAVAPRIAIVSAPCRASRGLPSPLALARLRDAGAALGWTGRDGALALEVASAPRLEMRYWGPARHCAVGFSRAQTSEGGRVDRSE